MLKDLREAIEKLPESSDRIMSIVNGAQQFDLTAVDDLVEDMANQNGAIFYPLYRCLPCDKAVIHTLKSTIIIEKSGDTVKATYFNDVILEEAKKYGAQFAKDTIAKAMKHEIPIEGPVIEMAFDKHESKVITTDIGYVRPPKKASDAYDALPIIASSAFDLMAQQNLFEIKNGSSPRPFRRRHKKMGEITHRVVDFRKTYTSGPNVDAKWHGKALHFVVGHWRRSDAKTAEMINGVSKIWITGHWRGDPKYGVTTKSYKAGQKFIGGLTK